MTLTQINKAGLDEIALDHVFTIGASGSSAYTFQGEGLNGTVNNPTLYLTRGKTYRFENVSGGHPIRIQSTSGASGTAYNTGVTNNAGSGTVIVEVQHDAPDVLYYQCTSHAAMNGILYITGALADGGVTTAKLANNAVTTAKIADFNITTAKLATNSVDHAKIVDANVTTAKIADDAVTTAKIAAGAVGNTELANNAVGQAKIIDNAVTTAKINSNAVTVVELAPNAVNTNKIIDANVTTAKIADGNVTTAKIADEAVTLAKLPHGTSSNDGKFLRANNGADPTFETVSGTTINNNADNRVITGSGTANTLNGEANLTFNGEKVLLTNTAGSSPSDRGFQIEASHSLSDGDLLPALNFNPNNSNTHRTRAAICGVSHNGTAGMHLAFLTKHAADGTQLATSDEKMRLDTSGRVGIGHNLSGAADYNRLVVHNPHSGSCWLQLTSTQTGNGINTDGLSIGLNTANAGHVWLRENADLMFATNNTKRMTILAGGGLAFNNDTADANALDDYEEGSYTVSVQGDSSVQMGYTYRQANYVKIGKYVFVSFDVRGTRNNMTGQVYMSLPFTSMTNGGTAGGGACNAWAIGTSNHYGIHVQIDNNTGFAYFTYQWANNNTSGLNGNLLYSNTQLRGQFAYITAS